jgi:hypothetical protein
MPVAGDSPQTSLEAAALCMPGQQQASIEPASRLEPACTNYQQPAPTQHQGWSPMHAMSQPQALTDITQEPSAHEEHAIGIAPARRLGSAAGRE